MTISRPDAAQQPEEERGGGPRSGVVVYNGTNYDDLKDLSRLGLVAAREFQIQSPLQLCTKKTVRASR